MPVTTIKLPEALKRRVQRLVSDSGTSVHAFMLRAVEQAADAAERRRHFVEKALAARAEFARTGKGHSMESVATYARKRALGEAARKPKARRWP